MSKASGANHKGATAMREHRPRSASVQRWTFENQPLENQRPQVLARLRSYGPAFDVELIAECVASNPGAVVAALNADGYHIEEIKCWRPLPGGGLASAMLYVLRVKCPRSGRVLAAPVPLGSGRMLETWQP